MKKQLEQRLQQLQTEFESGQKLLTDLKTRETEVEKSLLRIGGAIQVLQEELGKANETDNDIPSQPQKVDVLENQPETVKASNGK